MYLLFINDCGFGIFLVVLNDEFVGLYDGI